MDDQPTHKMQNCKTPRRQNRKSEWPQVWKRLFRCNTEDRIHERNDRLDFIKCKTCVKVSGEWQATDGEKVSAKDTSDKNVRSPKHTKNSQNSRIRKQTDFKMGSKTLLDTSPKKIQRWHISPWKDISHHVSSGKCKLERWDTTTPMRTAKLQDTANTKC